MSNEFSFLEFFKTCLRFWYVFLISAFIAVTSYLSIVSFRTFYTYSVYDGILRVASIDSFTGYEGNDLLKFYDTICSRAVKVMMDEEIKFEVYNEFSERLYAEKSSEKNKQNFFENLRLTGEKDTVKVSFSFPVSSKEDKELVEAVVISYMHRATLRATADSSYLTGKLSSTVYENLDTRKINTQNIGSSVQGAFLSFAVSVIVSFLVIGVIFLFDKRLKSNFRINVNNIVTNELLSKETLTKLDAFLENNENKKLFGVIGIKIKVGELVNAFAEEILVSNRKVLVVGIGSGHESERKAVAGYDYIGFNSLMEAIGGKDSFNGKDYDRVIIFSGNEPGTCEVLSRLCDRFIVVVNQSKALKSEFINILNELNEDRVSAAVITGTHPGFFEK